jgi:ribosomal-protein-alanine N-acetyltransferase
VLEVRESHTAAVRLYEKTGFRIIGKRNGYYRMPHEDAVIMGLEV